MKVLNLIGLYTKKQYKDAIKLSKEFGITEGISLNEKVVARQLMAAQVIIDDKNDEIKYLHNQIANNELDLQCKEAELASTYDNKIYRLENLQKSTKSYKKKKKIASRINELEFKKLEI